MKRLLFLLLGLGLVACMTNAASAVVIIGGATNNGYFDETHPVLIDAAAVPPFFLPQPDVWINDGSRTITGPYPDALSSEPFANGAATPQTTGGAGAPPRPEGCGADDCGVFFKAFTGGLNDGPATGHLYQDNPATPGMKYILTGWAGAEDNYTSGGTEFALEFLDGGGSVIPLSGQVIDLTPTLKTPNGNAFNYKEYMAMGIAPANAAEVRARVSMIDGIPSPTGGAQAFVVDDFTLTCVPEPASVALGLLGVVSLLGVVRRR
jgi:hypothetical protein